MVSEETKIDRSVDTCRSDVQNPFIDKNPIQPSSMDSFYATQMPFAEESSILKRQSPGINRTLSFRNTGLALTTNSCIVPIDIINTQSSTKSKNWFGANIRSYTHDDPGVPIFDSGLREYMEPHVTKARKKREEHYKTLAEKRELNPYSPNKTVRAPYPSLRVERSFLFDVETYPLHQILANTIGVEDLSLIHQHEEQDKRALLSKLLNLNSRKEFHECYDNFVTSICIPLIHSQGVSDNLFSTRFSGQQEVCYRYQAFPCIRVMKPGEFSIGPHCDMVYGHSIANINFHIPLTPTFGTNALYTETHPGKEDWHPLTAKSLGLGYIFDGARCLHFSLENTTNRTRVSLDFRIAISRKNDSESSQNNGHSNSIFLRSYHLAETAVEDCALDDLSCSETMLEDNYSAVAGYYDEAFVNLGYINHPRIQYLCGSVVRKRNNHVGELLSPDRRVGFPF